MLPHKPGFHSQAPGLGQAVWVLVVDPVNKVIKVAHVDRKVDILPNLVSASSQQSTHPPDPLARHPGHLLKWPHIHNNSEEPDSHVCSLMLARYV
jgi:hypothetical protein